MECKEFRWGSPANRGIEVFLNRGKTDFHTSSLKHEILSHDTVLFFISTL